MSEQRLSNLHVTERLKAEIAQQKARNGEEDADERVYLAMAALEEIERLYRDFEEMTCGDERYTRLGKENERLQAEAKHMRSIFWHPFVPQNPEFTKRKTCHECGLLEGDPIHE